MILAMWSGPRNLSTAMMYAFGARGDFAVWDEPFYAPYLRQTGLPHPMRDEILARYPDPPDRIAARITAHPTGLATGPGAPPPHRYLKLITHHMLDGFDLDWMAHATHVFLIRHPARVIASYHAKRRDPDLADLGLERQLHLFERAADLTGTSPPVLDSADILRDPRAALGGLCARLGLDFSPAMLSWPPGGHADDGIWAAHWYGQVHRSTGFGPAEGLLPDLPGPLRALCDTAMPYYEALRAHAPDPATRKERRS